MKFCVACRKAKQLKRFGSVGGPLRVCLGCRIMLESGALSTSDCYYLRLRMIERGTSPEYVDDVMGGYSKRHWWRILKDLFRGQPKPLK